MSDGEPLAGPVLRAAAALTDPARDVQVGSARYTAEQLRGRADTRTDLDRGWLHRTVGPVRVALRRVRLPTPLPSAELCLTAACACFLGAALLAVVGVWFLVDGDARLITMLLGILACGLTSLWCVPVLSWETVSGAAAAPVPAPTNQVPVPASVPAPVTPASVAVWVAPEPLWRCVQPLPHDGRPLSVQVVQRLREAIDAGRLVRGTALPADVDIARHLNVSAGVVHRAKTQVHRDGYLDKRSDGRFTIINARRRPPEHGAGPATRA